MVVGRLQAHGIQYEDHLPPMSRCAFYDRRARLRQLRHEPLATFGGYQLTYRSGDIGPVPRIEGGRRKGRCARAAETFATGPIRHRRRGHNQQAGSGMGRSSGRARGGARRQLSMGPPRAPIQLSGSPEDFGATARSLDAEAIGHRPTHAARTRTPGSSRAKARAAGATGIPRAGCRAVLSD